MEGGPHRGLARPVEAEHAPEPAAEHGAADAEADRQDEPTRVTIHMRMSIMSSFTG